MSLPSATISCALPEAGPDAHAASAMAERPAIAMMALRIRFILLLR